MAFRNAGMQVQEYVYDFAVDGGVYTSPFILSNKAGYSPLPVGAIVLDMAFHVVTAIVGSSSTIICGDGTDTDGYMESTAEATLVLDYAGGSQKNKGALVYDDSGDAYKYSRVTSAANGQFTMTVGTANLTAGKIVFMVSYLLPSA